MAVTGSGVSPRQATLEARMPRAPRQPPLTHQPDEELIPPSDMTLVLPDAEQKTDG